jgi:hypothetical protein
LYYNKQRSELMKCVKYFYSTLSSFPFLLCMSTVAVSTVQCEHGHLICQKKQLRSPYPGSRRRVAGLVKQPTRALKLVVFRLELDGCQPDFLAVGVGLESQSQNTSRCRHVTLKKKNNNNNDNNTLK